MKTPTITVMSDGTNMKEALDLAERTAAQQHLDRKQTLHLRLLAEEMMGLVRAITGNVSADFHIEVEGTAFRLYLRMDTDLDMDQRDHFLSVSSTGENAAAVGIMGMIRDMFEYALSNREVAYSMAAMSMEPDMDGGFMAAAWSLENYRDTVAPDTEAWDELEKSIVASVADDVQVSFRGTDVGMVILKQF